ncbi:hypothetical protein PTTW11_10279 [Pyrenophora teres f. teres]|uniref:Uncharacterized protein n=1 Tax=Pyrenophora teres f. teres TaxID=97479 RepID=A0A6S6WF27_9PLEO|nr:hypothetical protein PTTW11_10279 [Pyrenophora teres f. teres]
MAVASSILNRIVFTTFVLLLLTSVVTLGLASHAKWSLERYLPGLAWYIWKGSDGVYDEQLERQQWVTWEYDEGTEKLAVVRAVLGIVAGAVGVWGLWRGEMGADVKEASLRAKSIHKFALAFSVISVFGTLTSAIISHVLQHYISKECQRPETLDTYSTRFTCTRNSKMVGSSNDGIWSGVGSLVRDPSTRYEAAGSGGELC